MNTKKKERKKMPRFKIDVTKRLFLTATVTAENAEDAETLVNNALLGDLDEYCEVEIDPEVSSDLIFEGTEEL